MNREELELIDGFFNKGWCCDLDEVYKAVMKSQQENEQLKKQLDYLRSGKYLNQVKWERDFNEKMVEELQQRIDKAIAMLELIVDSPFTLWVNVKKDILEILKGEPNNE